MDARQKAIVEALRQLIRHGSASEAELDLLRAHAAAIEGGQFAPQGDRLDAERYRWIRGHWFSIWEKFPVYGGDYSRKGWE